MPDEGRFLQVIDDRGPPRLSGFSPQSESADWGPAAITSRQSLYCALEQADVPFSLLSSNQPPRLGFQNQARRNEKAMGASATGLQHPGLDVFQKTSNS